MVRLIRPALAASLYRKKLYKCAGTIPTKLTKVFLPLYRFRRYTISTHSQERMNHMEELLKQLLTEVREIKASQARTEQRLEGVEAESRATREGLARMENDMGAKVSALFDAREVQMDVNERVCSSLQRIESKLDRISLRVASHDAAIKLAK